MDNHRILWISAAMSLVVGSLGGAIGVAAANHVFSDVPTSSAFHDAIADVNAAGCVSGFPDGTFHPTDDVRRQQAAYWMANCLGRGAYIQAESSFLVGPGGDTFEADLALDAGGIPGVGTGGHLMVIANVDVDTSGDQQSSWTLEHLDTPSPGTDDVLDEDVVTVVDSGNPALTLNPSDDATLIGFAPAEPGATEVFRLSGQRNGGVPLANIRTSVTAIWVAFDTTASS